MSVQIVGKWDGVSSSGAEMFHSRIPLNIVAVYEDFESGLRLIDFSKRLKFRFDEEFTISTNLWKFEMLEIPAVRKVAAKEAAGADLILLATDNHHPLPIEVSSWLDQWVAERQARSGALVAAFSGGARGSAVDWRVEESLRDAAAQAQMQFLLVDTVESENQVEESFAALMKHSRGLISK